MPNPDIGGRREILTHYLADKPCEPDVDVESLARGTAGFSGAELFNLVNVAAVQAAVTGETTISSARLEWAKDRIIMGVERKSAVLTEESKRLTAYHEAGHAVVALRTPGGVIQVETGCDPWLGGKKKKASCFKKLKRSE